MIRFAFLAFAALVGFSASSFAEEKTKILSIGADKDGHARGTHEYMPVCKLLANCLKQTPDIEAVVSNGWPKDPDMLKDVKGIVLYTPWGGDVLFKGPQRRAVEKLLKEGAGFTAIHWSTGAVGNEIGQLYLKTLGGWFHTDFSPIGVFKLKMHQVDPEHPICRGWKEYELRDEFYFNLRFAPAVKPIIQVQKEGKDHTIAWGYERPDSNKGRSFGCVAGHFHDNFADEAFRRALVNGILWTVHRQVPKEGAPCKIIAKDLELPPPAKK